METRGRAKDSKNKHARDILYPMLKGIKVGEKIPTERNLAHLLSISRDSVRSLLSQLEEENIIQRNQGKGTFLIKSLSENKSTTENNTVIGAIVPGLSNPAIGAIVRGINAACRKMGFSSLIKDSGADIRKQLNCLSEQDMESVDGLIIYPYVNIIYEKEFLEFVQHKAISGFPMVLLDRYLPHIDTCNVVPDYHQLAYILTQHLIMLGHRSILNISMAKTGGSTSVISLRGYKQALQDYGIPFKSDLIRELEARNPIEDAYDLLKEYLDCSVPLPFTAIICELENHVYGAYKALEESGVQVPKEVAIVSEDGCYDTSYGITWTHIDYPWEKIGEKAVDLIKKQLFELNNHYHRHHHYLRHIVLPGKLRVRESCGTYLGIDKVNPSDVIRILDVSAKMVKKFAKKKFVMERT